MPVLETLITKIVLEIGKKAAGKTWHSLSRNDKVLKVLETVDLKPEKPKSDFKSIYAHTLVAYGVDQPEPVLRIFKNKEIIKAFEEAWRTGQLPSFEKDIERAVEQLKPGDEVKALGIDMKEEGRRFFDTFSELVSVARTPADQQDSNRIKDIHEAVVKKPSSEQEKKMLDDYLRSVVRETRRIDIKGIYSRSGSSRQAIHFPIEDIYTPLKTQAARTDDDPAALEKMADRAGERVPLTDLLAEQKRLLIVGEPGGGKTTFLRLIACVLAKDAVGDTKQGRRELLGMPLEIPAPIPIFLRLAALADVLKDGCSDAGSGAAWRCLGKALEKSCGRQLSRMLQSLLSKGQCALLLDGLDEVADENTRNRIVDVVNSALEHWEDNLIVLSSRPFGYHDVADLEQMVTARIDAFREQEIIEFLGRWGKGLNLRKEKKNGKEYLTELRSAIIDSRPIRRLARNPVMLTCLCVVHWNERKLPEGKADLLAAVLRWLLNAREENRKKRGYTNAFAEECFKALALAMTDYPDGKQTIVDLSWAADRLEMPFSDMLKVNGAEQVQRRGRGFLEEEMLDSGIVEKFGTGQIRFWHLNFQEYFAASALVDRSDDDWWKSIRPRLFDRQWTEVIDHLAGCLAWTGLYRRNLLVEKVLGTAKEGDLASIAKAVGVLGRILRILQVYDYQPPARLGWEKARDQVMDIFTPEGALKVPVEQRIAAADALGQAGDPRIKPLAPEMLKVPGTPGVLLGKYPVTVLEYERFVENRGYSTPKLWGEWWEIKEDKGWTEPGDWDQQIEHLDRPVTGVSWYEAVAYCNWLAAQSGLPYRLAKSEEWEMAATNPAGDYPWGKDEPNPELLNCEDNVGNATPVGVYPAGAAPGGHLDMAGNVWEWNWDLYDEEGSIRVMRGGSWSNPAQGCRSAYRYDNRARHPWQRSGLPPLQVFTLGPFALVPLAGIGVWRAVERREREAAEAEPAAGGDRSEGAA